MINRIKLWWGEWQKRRRWRRQIRVIKAATVAMKQAGAAFDKEAAAMKAIRKYLKVGGK